MKKDFTGAIDASKKRVQEHIEELTQETQEKPKKRYKNRKEYSEEEAAAFLDSFQSAGRKGLKLPRINLAFTPENYEYVRTLSRVRGESYTTFINWLIKTHKDENIEMYNKAHEFIDTM